MAGAKEPEFGRILVKMYIPFTHDHVIRDLQGSAGLPTGYTHMAGLNWENERGFVEFKVS